MKLTPRQLNQIAGIMEDESKDRQRLHNEMYSLRNRSLLVEAESYGDGANLEGLGSSLLTALEQDMPDMTSKVLADFEKVLFKKLAQLIAASGGEKVSGTVLQDDLEDFDSDELMMAQQEFSTDLIAALEKYASDVARLAAAAKLAGSGEG